MSMLSEHDPDKVDITINTFMKDTTTKGGSSVLFEEQSVDVTS